MRQELWQATSSAGWPTRCRAASGRIIRAQDWHLFQFDQTHIFTLMASYFLPRGFEVGARFRYVTGNPYTPVTGVVLRLRLRRVHADGAAPPTARASGPFNQLDLRVDKIFTFDRWRLSAYLDVQNVLRADNPEAVGYNYNYTVAHPITGLPLCRFWGSGGTSDVAGDELPFLCAAPAASFSGSVDARASPISPVSFVAGLRVLGIKAEPPQIAPGASTTLTTLVVDTYGGTPTRVLEPVQPAAVAGADGQHRLRRRIGGGRLSSRSATGLTIPFVMPQVAAASLGAPDATGGVYLPLVAAVDASPRSPTAVYRLRLADAAPPNANPTIAGVFFIDASGAMSALDPTAPMPVQAGEALSLTVTFTPDSAQTYTAADGTVTTELLTTSWFCTAGELSFEKTSATQPETVLHLDQRLPSAGTLIDLYAVARDERGGTDFAHRTLLLQ